MSRDIDDALSRLARRTHALRVRLEAMLCAETTFLQSSSSTNSFQSLPCDSTNEKLAVDKFPPASPLTPPTNKDAGYSRNVCEKLAFSPDSSLSSSSSAFTSSGASSPVNAVLEVRTHVQAMQSNEESVALSNSRPPSPLPQSSSIPTSYPTPPLPPTPPSIPAPISQRTHPRSVPPPPAPPLPPPLPHFAPSSQILPPPPPPPPFGSDNSFQTRIERKIDLLFTTLSSALSSLKNSSSTMSSAVFMPPTSSQSAEQRKSSKTDTKAAQMFDAREAMLEELKQRIEGRQAKAEEGAIKNF